MLHFWAQTVRRHLLERKKFRPRFNNAWKLYIKVWGDFFFQSPVSIYTMAHKTKIGKKSIKLSKSKETLFLDIKLAVREICTPTQNNPCIEGNTRIRRCILHAAGLSPMSPILIINQNPSKQPIYFLLWGEERSSRAWNNLFRSKLFSVWHSVFVLTHESKRDRSWKTTLQTAKLVWLIETKFQHQGSREVD